MINQKTALALNWHVRMLKGAIGTTSIRGICREGLTPAELGDVSMLVMDSEVIINEMRVQIKRIEDFWLKHGSERTQDNIKRRQKLNALLRACRYDEITEADWKFLTRRSSK